jgi:hypothetical protein
MFNAGTHPWGTAPEAHTDNAASTNDSSVTIKANLVVTDAANTVNDILLFKFPIGTQFATSTFVVDSVSAYFDATKPI